MSRWYSTTLHVAADLLDAAAAALYDQGAAGVEWDDGEPVAVPWTEEVWRGAGCYARAYFADDERFAGVRSALREWAQAHGARLVLEVCVEEDWASSWRQYYHAIRPGSRFWVVPAWEAPPAGAAPEDILWLDPGMAFGTGTHATTAMMLRLGERAIHQGERWLDVGTGSGILALMAWRLGAEVTAVEPDPVAVRVALENFARHEARVSLQTGTVADLPRSGPFTGLMANLTVDLLKAELPGFLPHLAPGSRLLLSGIIGEREMEVWQAATALGLRPADRLTDGSWVALAFVLTARGD